MGAKDTLNQPLADFLPYQLSIASNAVSSRISEQYRARFGLKVPEWRIMAVLGDAGHLTQRDLTAATLMDKVAVNRACKVLEDRGLAVRKPNKDDGRSHHLELTEEGRAMHGGIMPLARAMEAEIVSGFTDEELTQFCTFLARVRKSAGELDCDSLDDFAPE
ncbi:MarR family winged helix-turn-helix transcriptional regulator [Qipengyuania oceanensis]|uniref:MarR family transcriptional regulator n=1 Tax=Qipengyuania oceanensis TaxID=1463597 RepID=A0A844YBR9_9SPHN|nr:MarR family winged helix-turn-helix transcriptional regulator [Qipengyuania oceanensis]MXO62436.1 MarR family transcriptional regulator [Qipengyuania oceanensis]